ERLRAFLDEFANQSAGTNRDGREDMVARAALDEQRHDSRRIVAGLAVNGSPADDGERMHVAGALDVAASIEPCETARATLPGGSPVQWVGVVSGLACVWVGAVLEKQSDGSGVPGLSRGVQSGPAAVLRLRFFRANQVRIPGQRYA